MQNDKSPKNRKARVIAFCSVNTALGIVLMLTGGMLSIAAFAAPVLSSVLLIPVKYEFGRKAALSMFISTALLSLFLLPDKEEAFFYLFFGYYPALKDAFDRIKLKPLRLLSKFALFLVSGLIMYALLIFVFRFQTVTAEFKNESKIINTLFFVLLAVVMVVFDRAINVLTKVYEIKFRKYVRKLFR